MTDQNDRVVAIVREQIEKAGTRLVSVGVAAKAVARELKVSETHARKLVAEAAEGDDLVIIGHQHRHLVLPWPARVEEPPEAYVNGSPTRGFFELTEHLQGGPRMEKIKWVFTPPGLNTLMDGLLEKQAAVKAREEAKRRARQAQMAARENESWKILGENHPELADLLGRLNHALAEASGDETTGVRVSARNNPTHGFMGRVVLEVDDAAFDVLERVLGHGVEDTQ
jgi:hypothetical protein